MREKQIQKTMKEEKGLKFMRFKIRGKKTKFYFIQCSCKSNNRLDNIDISFCPVFHMI